MGGEVSACSWESINDFASFSEFNRFVSWIDKQVAIGQAVELEVGAPYLDATSFTEKWYRHIDSGETWRLVWPDGPFTGLFERLA